MAFYYNNIVDIYGISQDPNTKKYILVMKYAEGGSLKNYIESKFIKWSDKIIILHNIILGLNSIHQKELIHHNLYIIKIKNMLLEK